MPTSETELRLRHACTTLDRLLRGGEACCVEDLLAADPVLSGSAEATLELVYTDYAIRESLGHGPDADAYLARFPAIRDALAEQFHVHALMRAEGPALAQEVPRLIGPYELLDDLSGGSGGRVFRARHRDLGRVVALKLVPAAARGAGEAWAAAQLEHPSIVRLYEVGIAASGTYLAMEFVGGGTLADRLVGHPLAPAAAAELIEALARAAHHAHTRGVVHRDIKPANVLLATADDGRQVKAEGPGRPGVVSAPPSSFVAKLADFGLAAVTGVEVTEGVVGTPGYMAPEQARGDPGVGPSADVYALGAVLYECLTGRPPFRADSPLHTLEQTINDDPVLPRRLNPRIPRDLETVCLKCLHKSPGRRYPTAAALADDLARWRDGRAITARPVGPVERAWKWGCRQPLVAALLLLLGVAAVAIVAGGLWSNAQLRTARDAAERDAESMRNAYEAKRRDLYAIQLAQISDLYETDPGRALVLLEDPARCPPDLRDFAWGLFHRQCRQDVRTITGVEGVRSLQFSADGKLIRAQLPDGVLAWKVATGEPCDPFAPTVDDWSARAEAGGTLLTEQRSGQQIHVRLGFRPAIVAVDPTGQYVAAVEGRRETRLSVWDARKRQEVASAAGANTLYLRALAWSSDRRRLATGGEDRVVRVWDPDSLREVAALRGHVRPIQSLAFAPTGRYLASASEDHTIRVWPVDPPPPGPERSAGSGEKITALAFTPAGTAVVAVTADGSVKRWELPLSGPPRVLAQTNASLLALAVAADGHIAAGGVDRKVRVYDPDGRLIYEAATPDDVRGLAWSADGSQLACVGENGWAYAWAGNPFRQTGAVRITTGAVRAATFAPNGRDLMIACEDGRVVAWDTSTTTVQPAVQGHTKAVLACQLQPGGRVLATGGADYEVKLWDVESLTLTHNLTGHSQAVIAVAFTPDGRTLATGSGNRFANVPGEVKLWDVATGQLRATLRRQTGPLAFSPNGSALATVEDYTMIRLWRVD